MFISILPESLNPTTLASSKSTELATKAVTTSSSPSPVINPLALFLPTARDGVSHLTRPTPLSRTLGLSQTPSSSQCIRQAARTKANSDQAEEMSRPVSRTNRVRNPAALRPRRRRSATCACATPSRSLLPLRVIRGATPCHRLRRHQHRHVHLHCQLPAGQPDCLHSIQPARHPSLPNLSVPPTPVPRYPFPNCTVPAQ